MIKPGEQGVPHTDSPLQFDVSCEINAPPETVFDFLVDFEQLPSWMPLMKRVTVDNTNAVVPRQVGAVRVIDSGVGKPTLETVRAWQRPSLLSYSANDASFRGMFHSHLGVLTCEPRDTERTLFRWQTYAKPGTPPMSWIGRILLGWIFRRSMRRMQLLLGAKRALR
jgi:uncharacterized protein YndB with AHSA1/START domain